MIIHAATPDEVRKAKQRIAYLENRLQDIWDICPNSHAQLTDGYLRNHTLEQAIEEVESVLTYLRNNP
jgi:hypothetical protein